MTEVAVLYSDRLTRSQSFSFFTKDLTTHFEHHLEPFSSSCRILSETFHTRFLYLVPYLLPSAAKGHYFGFLHEFSLLWVERCGWLVDDRLSTLQQVGPCDVRAAHCDFLRRWVDIGYFVDLTRSVPTKDGQDPLGSILPASDESLRS